VLPAHAELSADPMPKNCHYSPAGPRSLVKPTHINKRLSGWPCVVIAYVVITGVNVCH
jgi:hypothetical protein